jgi:ATP synthase protein I
LNEQDSFEQRLRQARTKRGLDQSPAPRAGLPSGSWGVGFRAGVEVVSALAVGVAIGVGLDRLLGTWPWLFLLFFVAGACAGVLNVYRLFNPPKRRPH